MSTPYTAKLALIVLITAGGVAEVLNGLLGATETSASPGAIIRGLLTLVGIYFFLKLRSPHIKAALTLALAIALTASLLGLIREARYSVYFELNQISKLFFTPLFACAIAASYQKLDSNYPLLTLNALCTLGLIVALGILVSTLMGVQYATYGDYTFGNLGIMLSPNELGLCLFMANIIASFLFFYSHNWLYLLAMLILSAGSFLIASRIGIVGAITSPLLILSATGLVSIFRDRTITRANGLKVIVATLIISITTPIAINKILEEQYIVNKFLVFLESGSARGELQKTGVEILTNRPPIYSILGEGPSSFNYRVLDVFDKGSHGIGKRTEVDWIDVTGSYGVIISCLFYLGNAMLTFYFLFKAFVLNDKTSIPIGLCCALYLVHSIIAGHALMAPLPSTFISCFLAISMMQLYRVSADTTKGQGN